MDHLHPILNSMIGPRPAKNVDDVDELVRKQVEQALRETSERITALTAEIDDRTRARDALVEHRDSLEAWKQRAKKPEITLTTPTYSAEEVSRLASSFLHTQTPDQRNT